MHESTYRLALNWSLKKAPYIHDVEKYELLESYMNDGRSWFFHERIALEVGGYQANNMLRGPDGYGAGDLLIEVKTSNLTYHTGPKYTKLNGGGKFSNLKMHKLEILEKENLNMLIANYINGRLMYILEFPYSYEPFKTKIRTAMENKFPNGDIIGLSYSPAFSYTAYKDCPDLKLKYCVDVKRLMSKEKYISPGLFDVLLDLIGKQGINTYTPNREDQHCLIP